MATPFLQQSSSMVVAFDYPNVCRYGYRILIWKHIRSLFAPGREIRTALRFSQPLSIENCRTGFQNSQNCTSKTERTDCQVSHYLMPWKRSIRTPGRSGDGSGYSLLIGSRSIHEAVSLDGITCIHRRSRSRFILQSSELG